MPQIAQNDLKDLTSDEIRLFYTCENIDDFILSLSSNNDKLKKYLINSRTDYTFGNRINRVKRLLDIIIVERFINKELCV